MSETGTVQTGTDDAKTHTLLSDDTKGKIIVIGFWIIMLGFFVFLVWVGYFFGSTACKRKKDSVRDPYDDDEYCGHWIQKSIKSDSDLSECVRASSQGQNYGNTQFSANKAYAMDGDYYDTGSNDPQSSPKKDSSEEEEVRILRTF